MGFFELLTVLVVFGSVFGYLEARHTVAGPEGALCATLTAPADAPTLHLDLRCDVTASDLAFTADGVPADEADLTRRDPFGQASLTGPPRTLAPGAALELCCR